LKGRTVIDGGGRAIGLVEDVLVDGVTWRVEAFQVKLRREAAGEIGVDRGAFRSALIEVPVEMVHAAGDAVILNVPAASLRELRAAAEAAAEPPR
jgi:sporulation protein YlmC with PRC-barrel domain